MTDRTSQLLDTIDELIDEQLAAGEPENGWDYNDPDYPKCPHCGRDWHGLPITRTQWGLYDEDGNHQTTVLCEGADFIGPMDNEWRRRPPRREIDIRIVVDYQPSAFIRRYHEACRAFAWPEWQFPDNPFDISQWLIPEAAEPECPSEAPDITITFGPHNWGCELRTRAEQFLWEWGWSLSPDPLQALVNEHWDEFAAPEHQLPQRPGFDFTKYVSDDDPTWRIAPGWRFR